MLVQLFGIWITLDLDPDMIKVKEGLDPLEAAFV